MNAYLNSLAIKFRSKAIPWEGYQRAGLLTVQDVTLIQKITSASTTIAESIWSNEGAVYADLYLRLLAKLSRNDTLQLILTLAMEMIADREDRIEYFLNCADSPYPILLKLLDSPDDFVQLTASVLITTFLSVDPATASMQGNARESEQGKKMLATVSSLIVHLSTLIHKQGENADHYHEIAVECLQTLLRNERARRMVWDKETSSTNDGPHTKVIEGLVHLLRSSPPAQMQYQLVFCLWLLTFDEAINISINSTFHIIPLLTDLARNSSKEKIIRMITSTFRNLLTISPSVNIPIFLGVKLLPLLESIACRKFSDEEITEDVEFLVEELKQSSEGLTTYDEYTTELASGQLAWSSPPHQSEEFWAKNAKKLLESDKKVLKVLIELIKASQDAIVLAVAANDLGQFLKFCDSGKKAVEDLGARGRVMELMTHPDPDVKFQALMCVQRLISQPWAA